MNHLKSTVLICLFLSVFCLSSQAQQVPVSSEVSLELKQLIDLYSKAREERDTLLLRTILTDDIDQLVSSGEWRLGIRVAIEGMQRSSSVNEGKRTLEVERIRLLNPTVALVDARYTIDPTDGSEPRRMWSTFIAVAVEGRWKIAGIRNMQPTGSQ